MVIASLSSVSDVERLADLTASLSRGGPDVDRVVHRAVGTRKRNVEPRGGGRTYWHRAVEVGECWGQPGRWSVPEHSWRWTSMSRDNFQVRVLHLLLWPCLLPSPPEREEARWLLPETPLSGG